MLVRKYALMNKISLSIPKEMLLTNVIDNCDISGYDYEHDLSQSSNFMSMEISPLNLNHRFLKHLPFG